MTDNETNDAELMRESIGEAAAVLDAVDHPTSTYDFDSGDVVEIGLQLYRDKKTDFDPSDLAGEFYDKFPAGDGDDDDDNDYQVK